MLKTKYLKVYISLLLKSEKKKQVNNEIGYIKTRKFTSSQGCIYKKFAYIIENL